MLAKDTIVVVEDPSIRRYVRAVLARRQLTVTEANAGEAHHLVRAEDSKVCLLITNSPREFLPFAGDLPLLYLSANPDPHLASEFRACRTLRKPFTPTELTSAVTDLIGAVVT